MMKKNLAHTYRGSAGFPGSLNKKSKF